MFVGNAFAQMMNVYYVNIAYLQSAHTSNVLHHLCPGLQSSPQSPLTITAMYPHSHTHTHTCVLSHLQFYVTSPHLPSWWDGCHSCLPKKIQGQTENKRSSDTWLGLRRRGDLNEGLPSPIPSTIFNLCFQRNGSQ